jgi:hypothetical protein
MKVAMLSAKGSPGVTTLAMGVAARWPRPGVVVVEADPAGGDLLARFGHPPAVPGHEPGLEAMARAKPTSSSGVDPQAWIQPTAPGVDIVGADPGSAAAVILQELARRGPMLLRELERERPAVIVDAGRWHPGSWANPLVAAMDVVILVVRPGLEQFRQAEVRLASLRALVADVRLVTIGDRPWSPTDVAAGLGLPLLGVVPVEDRGAGLLSGRLVPGRGWSSNGWTRLPLLRACRSIAHGLDANATSIGVGPAPHLERRSDRPGEGFRGGGAVHRREQVQQR